MRTQKPSPWSARAKVVGALLIAAGIPALLFLGLSMLPLFVRGNQDLYDAIEQGDREQVQALFAGALIRNRRGAAFNSTVPATRIGGDASMHLRSSAPSSSSSRRSPQR